MGSGKKVVCCQGCGRDTSHKDGLCNECGGRKPRNLDEELTVDNDEYIRRRTDEDVPGD